MTTAKDLVERLQAFLNSAAFPPDDPNGLWRGDGLRPVRRLGLALTPPAHLGALVRDQALDALWLHHPWRVEEDALAPGFPVLAYHLSFDEALTPGYSPFLAERFGLRNVEVLGSKEGRPLGMIGEVEIAPLAAWICRLHADFGGYEALDDDVSGPVHVKRVAFVGAFWPEIVLEAAQRNVDLYVTGQLRKPGRDALRGTGMTALAIGHERGERWGLCRLAEIVEAAFSGIETVILPS